MTAPYRAKLSAGELARAISEIDTSRPAMGPAFSFFSEVPLDLQLAFVAEMRLSLRKVQQTAKHFQSLCPFPLALATNLSSEIDNAAIDDDELNATCEEKQRAVAIEVDLDDL
ncbi:hypothetical protein [Sulfitobacter sp. 1A13730]|uniref:hypothetical protein n=1 Tax=Sulfitobacter sp. 1A13730 TaxID=3368569 RepID=UPI0037451F29